MTDPGRHVLVKEIFLEACECPEEERSALFARRCGHDPTLRAEVEALLSFDEAPPTVSLERASTADPVEVPGYRVLQKSGEGGMGEVWEAEQLEPVRRRVALKLIKWGMDTAEVVARFESERQALALMSHPCIARVYDAGATAEGRPFFAMEYVAGDPITTYCDRRRLGTSERLLLFQKVCDGVQHAHQKGIIHRDLKPSNVLVTEADGSAMPKIIDFGVAKATSQRLTERTLFTRLGQWIGTPEYMSPEQADLSNLDVDTRSDVYSLGVVLYELLTGAQPFDPGELHSAGFDEMRRRIREDEPPRPSTRVSRLGEGSTTAAECRRTDTPGLVRTLKADLDWIVMEALEKDRAHRYGSAAELAADIGRYLADQPVQAGPPSTAYRMRKFVRRHRTSVAAAAVVAAALVAGITGTTMGLVRAREEAEAARAVSGFLVRAIGELDPQTAGQPVSASALLERAVQRLDSELGGQPQVRTSLMHTMGTAYLNLGDYERARPLLEQALQMRIEGLGPSDPEVVTTCVSLGWLEYWTGKYAMADRYFGQAIEILEGVHGPESPEVAVILGHRGRVLWRLGDHAASLEVLERALAVLQTAVGEDDLRVTTAMYPLGTLLVERGEYRRAESLLERVLDIGERTRGPESSFAAWVHVDLGMARYYLGDLAAARQHFERSRTIHRRLIGDDHPAMAFPVGWLAILDRDDGDLEASRMGFERALAIRERFLGPDHPDLVWSLQPYGRLLVRLGEAEAGMDMLERALWVAEGAHGRDHGAVARVLVTIGTVRWRQGDHDGAVATTTEALEINQRVFGPGHRMLARPLYNLACFAALRGDRETALIRLEQTLDVGWAAAIIFDDPDFASLRGDPAFERLQDEVRRRLED